MWGAAPILFRCARCSGTLAWARPAAATPAGAGPAASPHPRRGPFWGGGRPLGSGGAKGRSCGSLAGGGAGGGGRPLAPSGVGLPFVAPGVPPPGYTRAVGVAGRPLATGAVRSAADGSVRRGGGGEGGSPPALVRAPVFPGPASDKAAPFAPSWASPVRCRLAAGRACGRLPRPWCPRTPGAAASSGGCGAAVSSVCLCPLLGLSERGGGGGGGPLVPWRRLRTAGGGRGMAVPAPGASHRLGGRTLSRPPLPRAGPSCRPSLGPLIPLAVVARRWPARGGPEG